MTNPPKDPRRSARGRKLNHLIARYIRQAHAVEPRTHRAWAKEFSVSHRAIGMVLRQEIYPERPAAGGA